VGGWWWYYRGRVVPLTPVLFVHQFGGSPQPVDFFFARPFWCVSSAN